jgi:hypothetical protein
MLIPILPTQMNPLVHAPVPFLIGATCLPKDTPDDVILIDLQTKTITGNLEFPEFPRTKEFDAAFTRDYKELKMTFTEEIPYITTSHQLRLTTSIARSFERHMSSMFKNFRAYCIRDVSDKNKPISIFMKENYLMDQPYSDQPFLKLFLETQMFAFYSDNYLNKIDSIKI